MNMLPIIYFIVIFSGLNMSLQTVIQERNLLIEPDRVQHSLNQLALAQYQYYADKVADGETAAFASTIEDLVTEDYLPVWEKYPDPEDTTKDRFSMDATTDPNYLTLTYKADNEHDAGRIAARLGPVATLTGDDRDIVEVAYAAPIDASLMGIFLPRDGSLPITGDLTIQGNLLVEGDTVLEGDEDSTPVRALTVNNNTKLLGYTFIGDGDPGDLLATDTSINLINGEVVIDGDFEVAAGHEIELNGPTSIVGPTTIEGATTIEGLTTLSRGEADAEDVLSLIAEGSVRVDGPLQVDHEARFFDYVAFNGHTTRFSQDTEMLKTLRVQHHIVVGRDILANRDVEVSGDVTVTGRTSTNTLFINGDESQAYNP